MPGEIATAYVRLRPVSDTFRSEAQSQIKASLAQLNRTAAADSSRAIRGQVDLAKRSNAELAVLAREQARQNVKSASEQIHALHAIGESYKQLARDASLSSEERRAAAKLAEETESRAFVATGRKIDETKEKTHSLSESVKGLAATFGTTIGAIAGLNFFKAVVNGAAAGQKSVESIDASFGKSGQAIKKWSEGAAVDLGVSAAAAESTAARFGVAYRQIGIGQHLAATMTLNFEKLAGSIAAIRGVKPDQIFAALSTAAVGNTRSLRALGITIDQSQLKWAALKLGIIDTVKGALTPAQKAEAVYAIATSKLSQYQQQAKKHAGDLANQQQKLSAEWSNAKDILGLALLPDITKLVTKLATWLGKMEKSGRLQRDVNRAVRDGHSVIKALIGVFDTLKPVISTTTRLTGGLKNAIKDLIGVIVLLKTRTLLGGWLTGVGTDATAAAGKIGKLRGALGLLRGSLAKAFVLTFALSLLPPNKTAGGAATASGWGWVNKIPGGSFLYGVAGSIDKALGFTDYQKSVQKAINEGLIKPTAGTANWYARNTAIIQASAAKVVKAGKDWETSFLGALVKAGLGVAQGTARGGLAAAAIQQQLQQQIHALTHQYNVGDAVANSIFNAQIAARVKAAQRGLAAAISEGKQIVGSAQESLRRFILSGSLAIQAALKADHRMIAEGIRADQAALQSTGKRAIKNLQTLGSSLLRDLGKFQDALSAKQAIAAKRAAAVAKAAAAAKKAAAANLTGVGPFGASELLLQELMGGGRPGVALEQAITNVQSTLSGRNLFHQRVAKKVAKVKPFQETPAEKLAAAKRLVAAHINLLVEQASKGALTVKQLGDRLNNYLTKSGFTYHKLAKLLGKAGADKIKQDVRDLTDQLQQIGHLPAKLRKKLFAQAARGGASSPVISIVAELAKINHAEKVREARVQAAEKNRQTRYDAGLKAHLAALQKAQKRDRQIVAKAQQHLRDVNAADQLLTARHTHSELVKHTGLLKKIATATAKAAAAQKAIAAIHLGPTGYPSSTSKNPGATATSSRHAAHAGVTGSGG